MEVDGPRRDEQPLGDLRRCVSPSASSSQHVELARVSCAGCCSCSARGPRAARARLARAAGARRSPPPPPAPSSRSMLVGAAERRLVVRLGQRERRLVRRIRARSSVAAASAVPPGQLERPRLRHARPSASPRCRRGAASRPAARRARGPRARAPGPAQALVTSAERGASRRPARPPPRPPRPPGRLAGAGRSERPAPTASSSAPALRDRRAARRTRPITTLPRMRGQRRAARVAQRRSPPTRAPRPCAPARVAGRRGTPHNQEPPEVEVGLAAARQPSLQVALRECVLAVPPGRPGEVGVGAQDVPRRAPPRARARGPARRRPCGRAVREELHRSERVRARPRGHSRRRHCSASLDGALSRLLACRPSSSPFMQIAGEVRVAPWPARARAGTPPAARSPSRGRLRRRVMLPGHICSSESRPSASPSLKRSPAARWHSSSSSSASMASWQRSVRWPRRGARAGRRGRRRARRRSAARVRTAPRPRGARRAAARAVARDGRVADAASRVAGRFRMVREPDDVGLAASATASAASACRCSASRRRGSSVSSIARRASSCRNATAPGREMSMPEARHSSSASARSPRAPRAARPRPRCGEIATASSSSVAAGLEPRGAPEHRSADRARDRAVAGGEHLRDEERVARGLAVQLGRVDAGRRRRARRQPRPRAARPPGARRRAGVASSPSTTRSGWARSSSSSR